MAGNSVRGACGCLFITRGCVWVAPFMFHICLWILGFAFVSAWNQSAREKNNEMKIQMFLFLNWNWEPKRERFPSVKSHDDDDGALDMKFLKGTCLLNFREHYVAGGHFGSSDLFSSFPPHDMKSLRKLFQRTEKYHFKMKEVNILEMNLMAKPLRVLPVNMCKL